MRTVFEAAGGNDGLRRLAGAWHCRVMADDVVGHAFSHGFPPQHVELNLFSWNTVSLSPALQTTPARIVLATRAVLGAALLYWLNTGPVVEFFKRDRVVVPPQFRG